MFSGIVQNQGTVFLTLKTGGKLRLVIRFAKKEKNIERGESIAVNGVCLTVAAFSKSGFEADVVPETLKCTTLGALENGKAVNLERALRFGQRVGGHLVSGHVDGTGRLMFVRRRGRSAELWFEVPEKLCERMLPKGSVAVDGISLTIQDVRGRLIKIAAIPHTLKTTTLGGLRAGDRVNLEADMRLQNRKPVRETHAALTRKIRKLQKLGF